MNTQSIGIKSHNFFFSQKSNKSFEKPVVSIPVQKSDSISQSKVIAPVYFHPSFCSSAKEDSPSKQVSKLIDLAIANPKKYEKDFDGCGEYFPGADFFRNAFEPILRGEMPMGSGHFGEVYKLDEKYVLKHDYNDAIFYNNFKVNRDKKFDDLKIWYGNPVAKVGYMSILKNANPNGKAIVAGSHLKDNLNQCRKYYNQIYLPKCSNLPQKAFDEVAFDYKSLNKLSNENGYYYVFDIINPNNFLIDEKSIKIVDELTLSEDENPNSLSGMVFPLINSYKLYLSAQKEHSKDIVDMQKEILKKCVLASERAELPLLSKENEDINFSFDLIGHKRAWPEFRQKLLGARENILNIDDRVDNVEKAFDNMFNSPQD